MTSPWSNPLKSQNCQVGSLCAPAHSISTTHSSVSQLLLPITRVRQQSRWAVKHIAPLNLKTMLHFIIQAALIAAESIRYSPPPESWCWAAAAVRTAKFVARKQWIVCGSDDMFVRVYNYNTMDKVKAFEAHTDYIRSIAVHPTQPYLLTCSDDMLIKLWDWDKVCSCTQLPN